MVDLPTIANGVPSVHAPQSRVSAGDVAQPYNELATNLDRAGETLSKDVAVPLAQRAGVQAVSRDNQGNLIVQHLPIVGDAADAYSRAVKFSALALGEAEAKRADMKMAKEFQNDPEGYRRAADTFRKKYVDEYTKAAGPLVGISLGRTIDATTTQQYRGLLAQQQATIKRNFDHDTKASINDAVTDATNLIETGGADTPAGRKELDRLVNKVVALQHERVNNPVLAAPSQEAELQLKEFDQKIGAAKFAYDITKILKDPEGGPPKAMDTIDAMMNDQSIPPTQRVINQAHGLTAIKDFAQNNDRLINMANKQNKLRDQMMEDVIIRDTASGNPTITENDIKKSDMSPESKMRMLSWIKRDGVPEPLTQVSQVTTMELFRRMNLPDGDPSKITDLRPIRDAYAPASGGKGTLKREDEEWLEKRFLEARTPEGTRLNQIRSQFSKAVEPSIDKSNPLLGKIDQDGKMNTYRFERFVDQKVEEQRKAGKDPYDLFDPGSPQYLGKPETIEPFKKPLQQSVKDVVRNLTGTPVVPNAAPQRQPNETPAAYLRRIGVQ